MISVRFGSGQQRIFNTACQTAPLLDAINDGCYADMATHLKRREEVIGKELGAWKKKEASLQKKLEKLEPKQDEPGKPDRKPRKGLKLKRKAKKKKAEGEEKKEAPAEEAKEEAKEPAKEEKKGKKCKEEPPPEEEKKEETEEEKKARELAEVRQAIEQNKATQAQIQSKIEAVR